MKLFAILVFILNVMPDCSGDSYNRTYVLENNSGLIITIEGYQYGNLSTDRTLASGETFEGISSGDAHFNGGYSPGEGFGWDSVVLYFGDDKQLTHTWSGPDNRNILFEDSYGRESKKLYRFSFVQSDVDAASSVEMLQ